MFVEAKIFVSLRAICLSAKNSRVDVDADASLLALHQKWIILSLKLVIRQPQKNYFTVKKWLLARVDNKNNNLFNFLHRLWTLVQLADEVSFYLLVSLIPRLLLLKLDKQIGRTIYWWNFAYNKCTVPYPSSMVLYLLQARCFVGCKFHQ